MTALGDAKAHLAKAEEFLIAAELGLDGELFNVAAANAVISGINSKDAICLRLVGKTAKSDNHADAVGELKAAGVGGAHAASLKQLATTLGRLLRLKTKSQYQSVDVAPAVAEKAVEWARRMCDGAAEIVTE